MAYNTYAKEETIKARLSIAIEIELIKIYKTIAMTILLILLFPSSKPIIEKMVSSLAYVLYAISNILETYGDISYSFALTGVLIGTTLLLLSAYWHQTRSVLLNLLPKSINQYLVQI
jgi:hypothetical protein